jgi:hypothetical protein
MKDTHSQEANMKKMERFEVIDYGFAPQPKDDARLQLEGEDFNDYHLGSGWNKKEALQMAIELIEEHDVEVPKKLTKEMEAAETRTSVNDAQWNLAIRFYISREAEDTEQAANLKVLIEAKRSKKQALIEAGGFPEDDDEIAVIKVAA